MADSVKEFLEQTQSCEEVLDCFHGLNGLDKKVYDTVASADRPLTAEEIGEQVDRDRSTAYRSAQRLTDAGFVTRQQQTGSDGGYRYVYSQADTDTVADEMQEMVNDWQREMTKLIESFRQEY